MYFVAYLVGFLILIGGLAWAAITAGAPQLYVAIGSVILLGIGIITGVTSTRRRRHLRDGTDTDVTVIER